jgi:hypothetical protein
MFLLYVSNKDLRLEEHLIAAVNLALVLAAVEPGLLPRLRLLFLVEVDSTLLAATSRVAFGSVGAFSRLLFFDLGRDLILKGEKNGLFRTF